MELPKFSLNGANIPRLGTPFKIMAHHPTVVIECQCEAKTILCLVGKDQPKTCPACHHRFMIMDEIAVNIGALKPEGQAVIQ